MRNGNRRKRAFGALSNWIPTAPQHVFISRITSFYRSGELRKRSRRISLRRRSTHSRAMYGLIWPTGSFRPAGSTRPPPSARNPAEGRRQVRKESTYFREGSTTPSQFSKRGFVSAGEPTQNWLEGITKARNLVTLTR